MSYTIKWRREDVPADEVKDMTVGENPEKLTIACGVTDSKFDAWRIVDVDRSGKEPIFILRPASHARHNYPNGKDANH